MSVACGVDITYIPWIKRLQKNDHKLRKFFDPTEITEASDEHIAGILAAKEAFFKALGKPPKFLEVKVINKKSGKPQLIPSPKFQTYISADVSISHDKNYAIALVVLEMP